MAAKRNLLPRHTRRVVALRTTCCEAAGCGEG